MECGVVFCLHVIHYVPVPLNTKHRSNGTVHPVHNPRLSATFRSTSASSKSHCGSQNLVGKPTTQFHCLIKSTRNCHSARTATSVFVTVASRAKKCHPSCSRVPSRFLCRQRSFSIFRVAFSGENISDNFEHKRPLTGIVHQRQIHLRPETA